MTRRLLIAITVLLMAGSLFAADLFTLYVPVQVTQLHPTVTQVGVRCELSGRHPATGVQTLFARQPAMWFPVASGTYNGTATVIFRTEDFTFTGLTDPSYVNTAFCELQLRTSDGAIYVPNPLLSGPVVGYQPGTLYRNQTTQTIP